MHTSPTGDAPSLVVAIPTFKRPERLAQLLPLVGAQLSELCAEGLVSRGGIVVVDNDSAGSGQSAVEPSFSGIPTRYAIETTKGIPAVRNRAMDESKDFRLLSFIDDDELPRAEWLRSLVLTWKEHGRPTAVMGRVVSIFAPDVDPWVTHSGLFQRPERPTGTEISVAATGNLLLDLDQVRASGVRFDESIGLAGGSDTHFSMTLMRTGARMVWCNESVTEDTVEIDRQTRAWALKRAYSHGNVSAGVHVKLEPNRVRRAVLRAKGVAGGVARIVVGILRAAFGLVSRSQRHHARGLRLAYRGAGMIAGSLGRSYAAYAGAHAAPVSA
ncbi:glycosyltransferase family A protein [Naasia sp. SYSU D00057]|uniref:glycosyltransferase family A protein n=1 Tax=Naasia sp. SYSU D00057 TaxID=2817380 RepID=UPI001FEDBC8F|nr:glycosyltransferase family A protein [Naasia sp. SYSU D00057]